jgi:hypothetical protein
MVPFMKESPHSEVPVIMLVPAKASRKTPSWGEGVISRKLYSLDHDEINLWPVAESAAEARPQVIHGAVHISQYMPSPSTPEILR